MGHVCKQVALQNVQQAPVASLPETARSPVSCSESGDHGSANRPQEAKARARVSFLPGVACVALLIPVCCLFGLAGSRQVNREVRAYWFSCHPCAFGRVVDNF